MAVMKIPDDNTARRCLNLRIALKQGKRLHPEDALFVRETAHKFPEWHKNTELATASAAKKRKDLDGTRPKAPSPLIF